MSVLTDYLCIHKADVLEKFTDEKGGFKSTLRTDVQGLLGLYEASYLNTGGENVLEELARLDFNLVQSLHQKELRETLR